MNPGGVISLKQYLDKIPVLTFLRVHYLWILLRFWKRRGERGSGELRSRGPLQYSHRRLILRLVQEDWERKDVIVRDEYAHYGRGAWSGCRSECLSSAWGVGYRTG